MKTNEAESQTFALIVGIDDYPISPISGCVRDADNVYAYLTEEQHVPHRNIRVLKNRDATRDGILQAFIAHLIDNPDINHGDALLFHFSGHGARKPAPDGWPSAWKDANDRTPQLEMIIPYDGVADLNTKQIKLLKRRAGIPDRTLASLLRRSSDKHGNNITVVLDSCHSGHGTRDIFKRDEKYSTREVNALFVGDLDPDTDIDIWCDEPGLSSDAPPDSRSLLRAATLENQNETHVLMAACSRREEAVGSPQGGLFTTEWLKALRNSSIQPRTYAELHRHIARSMVDFDWQHPQCEGLNRDREVFRVKRSGADSREFAVHAVGADADGALCEIEAGHMHNVSEGTLFELRQRVEGTDTVLGTAVATGTVEWKLCVARLSEGVAIAPYGVRAFITQLPNPLKYAITNANPASLTARHNEERLRHTFATSTARSETVVSYIQAKPGDAPDLLLSVDENGVSFVRLDAQMAHLDIPPHPVRARDIEHVFPGVLGYIARFNLYLTQHNPARPFAAAVSVSLHTLRALGAGAIAGEYALAEEAVFADDDEATVRHDQEKLYGLRLRNTGTTPLFVYVVWFDPSTYSIELFHAPANDADAPLKGAPGGGGGEAAELQLGGSPECRAAMRLVVKEPQRDTGFLKIVLASAPVAVEWMQQPAMVGYDEDTGVHRYLSGRRDAQLPGLGVRDHTPPIKGEWDSLLRKITVEPLVEQ